MNLLITGVAGFIGSRIAIAAIKNGYNVIGVDDLSNGFQQNIPNECNFFKINLINEDEINLLPKDIDVILHLAGQSSGEISFDNPMLDLDKNVKTTLNLIKYGIQNKVKKIIHASSMSVYGSTNDSAISEFNICKPLSCYGTGKLAAENYLDIYKNELPYVSFRMFNVYGPGQDLSNLRQGMVSIYIAQLLKNNNILIKGSINRFRDFIYIDDVVNIWLKSIVLSEINNNIFNLGTGHKTTVFSLLQELEKFEGKFNFKEIENTNGDQFGIYADTTKLKKYFKFENFTSLSNGLGFFLEWSKTQLQKK